MNIIFRHTLRSIGNNRLQAAVIFLTVVAVTMMMFAAFSMTGVFYNINAAEFERTAGESDMLIGERAGGAFFARSIVENEAFQNDDIVRVDYFLRGVTALRAESANYPVTVEATDLDTFASPENGFYLVRETEAGEYPSALISERFSKEYGAELGSVIEILSPITEKYVKFTVTHILETRGFFGSAVTNQVVVDLNSVDSMGLINNAYVTLRDPALYEVYEAKFRALLPTVNVETAMDEDYVRSIANNNTLLLTAAVVFITIVMMLILFSSYLIVARTRMNEMVLFKAAGASPAQTAGILLFEVFLYGVAGSLVGVLLGRIVMGWAVAKLIPYAANAVSYEFWKFLASFVLGVAVCLLSALAPAMKIAGKPIRALTQGEVKEVKRKNPLFALLLTPVVIAFAAAVSLLPRAAASIALLVSVPFVVLWLVFALGELLRAAAKLFGKIFKKGGGAVAAKTAPRSGHVMSVTSLVAVVAVFAFMVVTTIDLVIVAVTPYNSRFRADIVMTARSAMTTGEYKAYLGRFQNTEGITDAVAYGSADFEFRNPNGDILGEATVLSVSDAAGLDRVSNRIDASVTAAFFSVERPLILNYDTAERFGLKVGDKVILSWTETTSAAEETRFADGAFTVAGIEYTETEWDRVAIANMGDLVSGGKERAMSGGIFLDADDTDAAFQKARDEAEKDGAFLALRFEDWYAAATKGLEGVATLLKFAEILFGVIAALGILNLSIVTFFDRKKEFIVYRLTGMDTREYYRFHLFEGGVAAIAGFLGGAAVSFFVHRLGSVLATLVSKFIYVPAFSWSILLTPLLTGAVFFALWTVLTAAFEKSFRTTDFKTERTMLQ